MDIYFVRHGQTTGNAAKRHQHNDSPLTSLGHEQAQNTAKVLVELKPTHLIVSRRVRAVETGRIIAAATNLEPELSELMVEIHRPDSFYGNYHRSPQTFWYLCRWFFTEYGGVGEGPYGESYANILQRIKGTKILLSALPTDARVVVVSHSIFINLFAAHMNHPRKLGPWAGFWTLMRALRVRNGSITHITYQADRKKPWRLERFAGSKVQAK